MNAYIKLYTMKETKEIINKLKGKYDPYNIKRTGVKWYDKETNTIVMRYYLSLRIRHDTARTVEIGGEKELFHDTDYSFIIIQDENDIIEMSSKPIITKE